MLLALLFCGGTALLAISGVLPALLNPGVGLITSAKDEHAVHAPLADLDSYIVSMMTSPHDLVFLNLSEIGTDKNYLGFKRVADGLDMRLPAFPSSMFDKRQSQYADKLKSVAESLSLKCEDQSEFRDGTIAGVNIHVRFTGDPQTVAGLVRRVIEQTFPADSKSECRYGFRQLPAESTAEIGTPTSTICRRVLQQKSAHPLPINPLNQKLHSRNPNSSLKISVMSEDAGSTPLTRLAPVHKRICFSAIRNEFPSKP